jgi:hypothetical protein
MQEQLTFWWEEPHASPSALPGFDKDLKTHAETSCLPTLRLLHVCGLDGLSGKTSPVSCHQTEDRILVPSLGGWQNWGMGSRTECWTLNGAEHTGIPVPSRSADVESSLLVASLSEVLETGTLPQKYCLSSKVCLKILKRADRRGKKLPQMLRDALEQIALPFKAI